MKLSPSTAIDNWLQSIESLSVDTKLENLSTQIDSACDECKETEEYFYYKGLLDSRFLHEKLSHGQSGVSSKANNNASQILNKILNSVSCEDVLFWLDKAVLASYSLDALDSIYFSLEAYSHKAFKDEACYKSFVLEMNYVSGFRDGVFLNYKMIGKKKGSVKYGHD